MTPVPLQVHAQTNRRRREKIVADDSFVSALGRYNDVRLFFWPTLIGNVMNNIKKAAKYVASNPDTDDAKALLALAVALETNAPYKLHLLFELEREHFKLALGLIEDWRLDRHYLSKLRLLDHAEIN